MTSPELLTLSSEEFHFNVSYTQASEALVNFGNSSAEHYLAFKVRTMEPKMYTVKPSSGLIPPGETIPVKITFQGTKNESALEEFLKAKQAFQLQWREIYQVPSPADNAHSLMKPKNKEGGPLEQKLVPCRFELPPKQPDSAVPEEDSKEVYQTTESFEDTQDTQEPPPQPPSPSAPEKDESAKKPKSNSPPPYRLLREKEKKMLSTEGQQQQQSEEQQSSSPVNNAPAETDAAAAAEETAFKETESDVVPTAATASNDKSAAKDSNGNVTETAKENEAVSPVEKQPPAENLSTAKKLLSRISKAFEFAASPGKESVVPPSSPAKEQHPEPKQKAAAEPAGKESEAVSPAKQLESAPGKDADLFAKDSKQQPEKQTLVQSSAEPPKTSEIAPRVQQLDMSPSKNSNVSAKGQQQPTKPGSVGSKEKLHKKSEIASKEPQTALGKDPDASGQQQQQVKSPPVKSNVKPHEEAASPAKQNETAPGKDSGASLVSEQQQPKKDEKPDDHQTFDLLTAFCALLVALFAAYIIFG